MERLVGSEIQQSGGGGGRGYNGEKGLLVLPVDKQMMPGRSQQKAVEIRAPEPFIP